MTPHVRRGTAQRLGLRLPPPDLVYVIETDLPGFRELRTVALAEPFATLVKVRASFEAFTRHCREAP